MLATLKGGPLWAAVIVVLAVIGASTALVYNGTLTGDLWLAVIAPIIAAVTGVTAAHVSGQQVTTALNMPPPAPAAVAGSTPGPADTAAAGNTSMVVALPAPTEEKI